MIIKGGVWEDLTSILEQNYKDAKMVETFLKNIAILSDINSREFIVLSFPIISIHDNYLAELKHMMGDYDLIPTCQKIIRHHMKNEQVLSTIIWAISSLLKVDNMKPFFERGNLELSLLEALRHHIENPDIVKPLFRAFWVMARKIGTIY